MSYRFVVRFLYIRIDVLYKTGALAQGEPLKPARVTSDELKWVVGPTGNQNVLIEQK